MKTNFFTQVLCIVISFFFFQTNSVQAQEVDDKKTLILIKFKDGSVLDTIINNDDEKTTIISDKNKIPSVKTTENKGI